MAKKNIHFVSGIIITLIIAFMAKGLSFIPFIDILGQLVIALLIGISWKCLLPIRQEYSVGVEFSSKTLLRLGIILLGMRLNLLDIYHSGIGLFLIAVCCLVFALIVVYLLNLWLGGDKKIGLLTACGTAICGAAAIASLAPQLKSNQEEVSTSVAIIAVLGTIFTLAYTFLFSFIDLSPFAYGIFAGATLHEIAHVVAASEVGSEVSVDMAVIVKLTRVLLLVPVAFALSFIMKPKGQSADNSSVPVPWFIFGFLLMSGFNTLNLLPQIVSTGIVNIAYFLLAMAMAGFGLNVNLRNLFKRGKETFIAGLIGSTLLSLIGYAFVVLLYN
ncbi:YeiH family protein [Litchfieldia salsa]|uniref:Conserved hypothetical integral membrane protein n=1 Tax=Litchfieldia salsa TaxID=930152 RepID=A0A1H0RQQ4_9BACI|nr:YeiH family protein [Litchfieldia salsa]SDP31783.1 conserved hypothetical integral membrane protein [Litchfieldia salsa]